MWDVKDGVAYLVKKPSSNFNSTIQNGLTLYCPKKNMWDWEDEEKWLRSAVVDDKGKMVSCGWPKFGNYGEFFWDTQALDACLKNNGEVHFTLKHDGSLAIRSVINGEVIFRTRGTLFGGGYDADGNEPFGVKFRKAAEDYPKLLDPQWQADKSLLFEYVSPENKIVISYTKSDLIFLGFANHNLTLGDWREVKMIAEEGGLNLVEICELPYDPKALIAAIKEWDQEGVVARCCSSQVMVKVKSASYLAKHRIKSNMNYNFIVEYVELSGVENEDQLVAELKKGDIDFEVLEEAKSLYHKYQTAVSEYDGYLAKAKELHEGFECDAEEAKEHRKQFAAVACRQSGFVRTLMFALYGGKDDILPLVRRKICQQGDK